MPDEEMEIMADFGHEAFAEDIDIDLDLAAAAHPDEDLELADFDHSADLHIFNSDGRDEMMAEGDDASYGMIDADEIDNIQTNTNTDDIEIDLGGMEDGQSWHEPGNATLPKEVNEIDFVDADDNAIGSPNHESHWRDDEATIDSPKTNNELSNSETTHANAADDASGLQQHSEEVATLTTASDSSTALAEQSTGVLEGTQPTQESVGEVTESLPNTAQVEDVSESHVASDMQGEVVPNESKGETESTSQLEALGAEAQTASPTDYQAQDEELGASHQAAEQKVIMAKTSESLGYVGSAEYDGSAEVQPSATSPEPHPHEAQLPAEQGGQEVAQEIDYEHGDGADELNEPPALEPKLHEDPEQQAVDSHEPLGDQVTEEINEERPHTESAFHEDLESVTARHGLVISYKRTDYRLFAESEDDDPDAYFLKDQSILNDSMDAFLAALRDVVSGEISPLDELVLHVDGLGLDFAESSSINFLKEHTFGELLVLYDQLTLNDGAETVPPFYSYLLIRPSGAARLVALQESAKSGHGLSQVAVYREFSPDEDMDDVHSPAVSDSGSEPFGTEEEAHDGVHTEEEANDGAKQGTVAAHVEQHEQDDETVQADTTAVDEVAIEVGDGVVADEEFYDELDLSPQHEDEETFATNERLEDIPTGAVVEQDASRHDEAVLSANSSATVTANGDEHDEIGYSDEEDEVTTTKEPEQAESATAKKTTDLLEVSVPDDEITWESDREDAEEDIKRGAAPTSPMAGKRTHSESTGVNDTGDQNGVKRQRS